MISNNKGHLELFYPNFSSLGICELEYITLTFIGNKIVTIRSANNVSINLSTIMNIVQTS